MEFQKIDIGTQTIDFNACRALREVVLNNPPTNIIDDQVLGDLEKVIGFLRKDSDALVVLTRSALGVFSTGANLKRIQKLKGEQEIDKFLKRGQDLFSEIEHLGKLTIAAVHGGAWGGGFELVLAHELIWAPDPSEYGLMWKENETVFCLPETDFGIISGWGGNDRLAQRIGKWLALEYIACAREIGAFDASVVRLVTHLFKTMIGQEFINKVREQALWLADRPQSSCYARSAVMNGGAERERGLFAKSFEACNASDQIEAYFEERARQKGAKK